MDPTAEQVVERVSFGLTQLNFLPLILIAGAVSLLVIYLLNLRTRLFVNKRWSYFFYGLRVAAILIMLLAILHPILRYRKVYKSQAGIALALDTSESMAHADDKGTGISRIEKSVKFLRDQRIQFFNKLQTRGDVQTYGFDSKVYSLDYKSIKTGLAAAGRQTNLIGILDTATQESKAHNVKSMILISDGVHTTGGDVSQSMARLNFPVYVIGMGKSEGEMQAWRDVSLDRVKANDVGLKDQESVVRLTVKQSGFANREFPMTIREGENMIGTQQLKLDSNPQKTIDVAFKPKSAGLQTFTIEIPHDSMDQIDENDKIQFSMFVTESKIKVLYIEGALRWEYKHLKRYMQSDPAIEAAYIIRTGGTQFYQQGRLKVKLKNGFPASRQELEKFDVVILGNLPEGFPDQNAIKLLNDYVSSKGKGVLFIAGLDLLNNAAKNPALKKMLPVNANLNSKVLETPMRMNISPQGRGNPLMRGIQANLGRLKIDRVYTVNNLKPAATEFLSAQAQEKKYPLMATMNVGKGRSAVLLSDRFWVWDSQRKPGQDAVAARLWGQLIRRCANYEVDEDGDQIFVMLASDQTFYQPKASVALRARVRKDLVEGKKGKQVRVTAKVLRDGRDETTIRLNQKSGADFGAGFVPSQSGNYVVELTGKADKLEQTERLVFKVGNPFQERERIAQNEALLRDIALSSGGKYYRLDNALQILDRIDKKFYRRENRQEVSVSETPWYFGILFALFCVEWSLRRRKRLI